MCLVLLLMSRIRPVKITSAIPVPEVSENLMLSISSRISSAESERLTPGDLGSVPVPLPEADQVP